MISICFNRANRNQFAMLNRQWNKECKSRRETISPVVSSWDNRVMLHNPLEYCTNLHKLVVSSRLIGFLYIFLSPYPLRISMVMQERERREEKRWDRWDNEKVFINIYLCCITLKNLSWVVSSHCYFGWDNGITLL